MPFKVLRNLIQSPAVHQKGEIVNLDAATADNLKRRGLVEEVNEAVTHLFGQKGAASLGGKSVNEEADLPAQTPQPTPAAESPAEPPKVDVSHADPVGQAKDQQPQPAQTPQPQAQAQAPKPSTQPSAAEIAATADAVK